MAKAVKAADELHRISPPDKLEPIPFKEGCIKIQFSFLTYEPLHIRSEQLRECGIHPPYIEDICVLIPCGKVFPLIETFIPMFQLLQDEGIVTDRANLQEFKILDEDVTTLAYPL